MTLHPSDLQTLNRTQTALRQIADHDADDDKGRTRESHSARARIVSTSHRIGGRTGYLIAGATGLFIVLLAELAG